MTSPDQAPSLRQIGVAAKVFGHFDEEAEKLLPHVQEPWVAISFGARWIFSESLLYGVTAFAGRLLNAHGTRLPMDRGGGGFSWRVMRGDRIGCLLLHKMTREIDAGPIVAFEDYLIPRALQTSAEIGADYERRQLPFVISYLEKGAPIESLAQPTYSSGYFPRLHTPTHAWIDWAWAPEEIERFILAFDDPYPGARTY
jgi:methionyl-tRNA formyltransferase